jgi:hypothetical protein
MACFAAPTVVAIVTTLARKKIPKKYHINWLNAMLWGGSAGLALEHVAHGEIVSYFPFLTALKSAEETAVMVQEILTVGGGMLVACVIVWALMVYVAWKLEAKAKTGAVQTA